MKKADPKKKRSFADLMDSYKTYDTKDGFGNTEDWKISFRKRMGKEDEKISPILDELFECNTLKELKSVHKKLMKQYHPDIAGNTVQNNKITQQINKVYKKLSKQLSDKENMTISDLEDPFL